MKSKQKKETKLPPKRKAGKNPPPRNLPPKRGDRAREPKRDRAAKGPAYRVLLKSKATGNIVRAFAVWESEYGYNLTAEDAYGDRPGVKALVLTNGKTVKCDSVFLNMVPPFVPGDEDRPDVGEDDSDDDDIPF